MLKLPFALLLALAACSPASASAVTPVAAAEAGADAALPSLLSLYRAESMGAAQAVPVTGDAAVDVAARDNAFAQVDARWDPVWAAWRALAAAADVAVAVQEAGGVPDPAPLLAAYCALRALLPANLTPPSVGACP